MLRVSFLILLAAACGLSKLSAKDRIQIIVTDNDFSRYVSKKIEVLTSADLKKAQDGTLNVYKDSLLTKALTRNEVRKITIPHQRENDVDFPGYHPPDFNFYPFDPSNFNYLRFRRLKGDKISVGIQYDNDSTHKPETLFFIPYDEFAEKGSVEEFLLNELLNMHTEPAFTMKLETFYAFGDSFFSTIKIKYYRAIVTPTIHVYSDDSMHNSSSKESINGTLINGIENKSLINYSALSTEALSNRLILESVKGLVFYMDVENKLADTRFRLTYLGVCIIPNVQGINLVMQPTGFYVSVSDLSKINGNFFTPMIQDFAFYTQIKRLDFLKGEYYFSRFR